MVSEISQITTEIEDLAMGKGLYKVTFESVDGFDVVTVTCPEWIGLMDQTMTSFGYEMDITFIHGTRLVVKYMREVSHGT